MLSEFVLSLNSNTNNQAEYFGLKSSTQLSPMMEKCALLISANESYQRGEKD
jgi:hypothetical protein